jgi:hypothetical protein
MRSSVVSTMSWRASMQAARASMAWSSSAVCLRDMRASTRFWKAGSAEMSATSMKVKAPEATTAEASKSAAARAVRSWSARGVGVGPDTEIAEPISVARESAVMGGALITGGPL